MIIWADNLGQLKATAPLGSRPNQNCTEVCSHDLCLWLWAVQHLAVCATAFRPYAHRRCMLQSGCHIPTSRRMPCCLARQAPRSAMCTAQPGLKVVCSCSVNPARSFGTSAVSHSWTNQWIFWVGPFSGAILAAIIYEALFRTHANTVSCAALQHSAPRLSTSVCSPHAPLQARNILSSCLRRASHLHCRR